MKKSLKRRDNGLLFKYVIFDMDGLMIDSESLTFEVLRDYLAGAGQFLSVDFYVQLVGKNIDVSYAMLEQRYPGIEFDRIKLEDMYISRINEGKLDPKPGIYELLDTLDKAGIKKSVASSNTRKLIDICLDAVGLSGRFEFIVCDDGTVKNCKPAPDLFLEAARLMNANPEECLVLEDSEAGVRAGLAAGCKVIAVPDIVPVPELYAKQCYAVLESLYDINKLFVAT